MLAAEVSVGWEVRVYLTRIVVSSGPNLSVSIGGDYAREEVD